MDEDHAAGLLDHVEVVALAARLRDEDRLVEVADLDEPGAADPGADGRCGRRRWCAGWAVAGALVEVAGEPPPQPAAPSAAAASRVASATAR